MSQELLDKKLIARTKSKNDFIEALTIQVHKLASADEVRQDFYDEMSRFIPLQIKKRTIDTPDYWTYVQAEITEITADLIGGKAVKIFDMG